MRESFPRLFKLLPILAFLAYWVYACLICAVLTGDLRLIRLGVVTAPLLAVMAAAAARLLRREES